MCHTFYYSINIHHIFHVNEYNNVNIKNNIQFKKGNVKNVLCQQLILR